MKTFLKNYTSDVPVAQQIGTGLFVLDIAQGKSMRQKHPGPEDRNVPDQPRFVRPRDQTHAADFDILLYIYNRPISCNERNIHLPHQPVSYDSLCPKRKFVGT